MRQSRKKNSHIKSGSYVEVSCPASSSYEELCELCAEALEMDSAEDDAYLFELRLFRIDGTVVPNKPIADHPWTVAEYLRAQKRHAAQMKFGVGFVDSFLVSTCIFHHQYLYNIHNT